MSSPASHLLLEPTPFCFHNMGCLCGHVEFTGEAGKLRITYTEPDPALLCAGWLRPFPLSCQIQVPVLWLRKHLCSSHQLTSINHEAHIRALHWVYYPPGGGENGLMRLISIEVRPELEIHLTAPRWAAGSHHHKELLPL